MIILRLLFSHFQTRRVAPSLFAPCVPCALWHDWLPGPTENQRKRKINPQCLFQPRRSTMKARGLKQKVNESLSSAETRQFRGFLVAVQRGVSLVDLILILPILSLPQQGSQASWDWGSLLDSVLEPCGAHLPGRQTEFLAVPLGILRPRFKVAPHQLSLRPLPLDRDLRCRASRPPVPLPPSGWKIAWKQFE